MTFLFTLCTLANSTVLGSMAAAVQPNGLCNYRKTFYNTFFTSCRPRLYPVWISSHRRQFELAFRMFDLNGDGDVDAEEFEQVQEIMRQSTSTGKKHREHGNTGSTIRGKKMNSALATYFFGQ